MNPFPTITLLIVDDEADIRSGLRSIIPWEDYGISVIGTAANAAEALDKIRYYEPDIVITDIQMPGMNGLELVRRAKKEQFDCSFVILSGYDEFEYAKSAIKYGVKEYLLKPISIKELTELILSLKEDILSRRNIHSDRLSTLYKLRNAQISIQKFNLIPQLLRGDLSSLELEKVIQDYSLPIRDKESCIVLIQAFSSNLGGEELPETSLSLIKLKNSLEQSLTGSSLLTAEYPPTGLLLLVNLPFTAPDGSTLKETLVNHIRMRTEAEGKIQIAAAIGQPVPSLLGIPASFKDARQTITWHIYPKAGPVLESGEFNMDQPPIIMPGNEILEAILKDNPEDILSNLNGYLDQLLNTPAPPPSYLFSMCNYLVITLQSQLSKYLDGMPKSYTGNSFATLQSLNSLDEIRRFMCRILCAFADELSVNRAVRSDPLIEKAIDYINKNLLKNPRTEDVCTYLSLSKSYFSTYFKNKTKLNFRDYTLDLKINYAQEQLKFSEHSPSEVSILLGYEDYRSFSRAFKARTGLTPTDFQKQYTLEERSRQ